ncbi:MAG: hypothetical protein D6698_04105 [Gammaproteobacteria bacterium]|nr:MAG: hypothetical protein D6698_04105 [Gammaproteobacteria bacterium]
MPEQDVPKERDPLGSKLREIGGSIADLDLPDRLPEPSTEQPKKPLLDPSTDDEDEEPVDDQIVQQLASHRYVNWYDHKDDSEYSPENIVKMSVPELSSLIQNARNMMVRNVFSSDISTGSKNLINTAQTLVDLIDFASAVKRIKSEGISEEEPVDKEKP